MNRSRSIPVMLLVALLTAATSCGPAEGEEDAASTTREDAASTMGEAAMPTTEGAVPAPLESVRNFQIVDDRLASAGQIAYEQVPLIRERGYEVVINLAVADEERNGREGFHVAEEGLTYVHIPVEWTAPRTRDVQMFFDVMEANRDRKVFVHCAANMRASAFVYLYRTLVEGVPEEEARATLHAVWDPAEEQPWRELIERVKAEYVAGG